MMSLDAIFSGPLAEFRPSLIEPDADAQTVPGSNLLSPGFLSGLLDRFARQYPDPDRLAVATQWSKWHFALVLPPAFAALLVTGHELPVDLQDVEIVIADDGRVTALKLGSSPVRMRSEDRVAALERMIDRHLDPLITVLKVAGSIPVKVLWSNAGNVFENLLAEVAEMTGPNPLLVEAHSILEARLRPDGQRNPLYQPVCYVRVGETIVRKRRLCCLRYRIPTLGLCKNCPLEAIHR